MRLDCFIESQESLLRCRFVVSVLKTNISKQPTIVIGVMRQEQWRKTVSRNWVFYNGFLFAYLSTLLAFSFFSSPMYPMMVCFCLFSILSDTNVTEGWLTRQLLSLHQRRYTSDMCIYFACRTLHTSTRSLHIWCC